MNMIEIIKEKTLWLIGAVLITIPLLACYPILKFLGLSSKIATIVTACLSGIAYILLVTYIQPFLCGILPFMRSKPQNIFETVRLKQGTPDRHVVEGPSSYIVLLQVAARHSILLQVAARHFILSPQGLASRSLDLYQTIKSDDQSASDIISFKTPDIREPKGNWIHS